MNKSLLHEKGACVGRKGWQGEEGEDREQDGNNDGLALIPSRLISTADLSTISGEGETQSGRNLLWLISFTDCKQNVSHRPFNPLSSWVRTSSSYSYPFFGDISPFHQYISRIYQLNTHPRNVLESGFVICPKILQLSASFSSSDLSPSLSHSSWGLICFQVLSWFDWVTLFIAALLDLFEQ